MERAFWSVMTLLTPLIFLALPCTIVSVVCGALAIANRSRRLAIIAAACSVPMFLYVLMGEAWWRPIVPVIVAMYFAAAYAIPQRRALAALLIAPYFIFVAMTISALYFRAPETYRGRIEWHAEGSDIRPAR